MSRTFSNIIIFNNETIDFIENKITSIFEGLDFEKCEEKEAKHKVDIVNDNINNICVVSSDFFKFEDSDLNKSTIRKVAKRVAQDAFLAYGQEDFAVLEKYSFNKRIYDYIAFGEDEKLDKLGYENKSGYMYPEVWKNHFVGRNTIADVDKLISQERTFFAKSEIIVEILKLYGIKYELATYNVGDYTSGADVQKVTVYFK